ncbi:MAG: hypothetical protein WC750_06195 [Patescibacteria group bacterium]
MDEIIYLVLALIEIDATDTVFFKGLEDTELVAALLVHLQYKETEYLEKYLDDYGPDEYISFLGSNDQQLNFNVDDLKALIAEIKTKGEEHYGFKKFVRMDEGNTEERDAGKACA